MSIMWGYEHYAMSACRAGGPESVKSWITILCECGCVWGKLKSWARGSDGLLKAGHDCLGIASVGSRYLTVVV